MVQKIVDVKDPILRKKAKLVEKIDKKILLLIKNMHDTLDVQKDPEGVGLAAPQIGKSYQIFVVNYKKLERTIINPKILKIDKIVGTKRVSTTKAPRGKEILEGCLSLPHYYGPIKRADKIKIEFLNEKGEKKVEEFKGFDAQIIAHEIDHLNGILFIDKILEQKAPLYKFNSDNEWEEVKLV